MHNFKLHAVLSSMMKHCAVLRHPARGVTPLFVQHIHAVSTTYPLITW